MNDNINTNILSQKEEVIQNLSEHQLLSKDKQQQQSLIARFNNTLHHDYELTSPFNKDKYKLQFDGNLIEDSSSLAIKHNYDLDLREDPQIKYWEYAAYYDKYLNNFLDANLYSSRKNDRHYIKQSLMYTANIIYRNKLAVFELDSLIEKIKEIAPLVATKICKDIISKFLKHHGYVNVQQKLNNKRHHVYKHKSLVKHQSKKVKQVS